MIDMKTLRELVKLMSRNGLSELDIKDENEHVKLKRGADPSEMPGVSHAVAGVPVAAAQGVPVGSVPAILPVDTAEAVLGQTIDSPMVGTYYTSSSPDAKAFVAVGDRVTADTVICIVEAMKVFNEIKPEVSGTITKMLVENGQAVEFDQPLFEIKTD